jgi:NAD(P)H dehydrogenase (quinone)
MQREVTMKALIIYHSKTGHTLKAANDIARGLEEAGIDVTVKPAGEVKAVDVAGYDIFVAGSPTYATTMYKAPAKTVARLLDTLRPDGLSGKYAGAFSAYAASGGEKIVSSTEARLSGLGATVVAGGPAVKAGAPLSLYQGPDASEADVAKCVEFGRRLAETAKEK